MACAGKSVGLKNLYLPSHVDIPSTKIFNHHFSPRRLFLKNPKDEMKLIAIVRRNWGQVVCASEPESAISTSTLKDSKPEAKAKVENTTVKPVKDTKPEANAKVESTAVKPVKDITNAQKAPTEVKENATSVKPAPPKAKVAAATKAPPKPLPEMMAEEVIPAVKAILEKEEDISDIELAFEDNKLEGSFAKGEIPYSFWVFFLDGTVQGLKAFSLTSYGAPPSTFEPFLTIDRKPTSASITFGIHKRLSAQRILPEKPVETKQ
ncbi:hypothetical protein SUGI_0608670 [Cryptomeria japonica]|uniref:uncharacterized protein LOC131071439 n=1 Tax=Cryptomeria japonica TaxID=3369 RepID=UPI002414AEC5|nr:uncharacterized protein LOC131071439 [Cryptomeria japonica]GLJ30711.1 hypothetical protein SUGI_0608670 [Cryptomeria japonica]